MNWVVIGSVSLFIATIYALRLILILPCCSGALREGQEAKSVLKDKGRKKGLQCFIFLGSGGHTGEMLRLMQNYKEILFQSDVTLHIGYSDIKSLNKMQLLGDEMKCNIKLYGFKKAREVNSGLLNSIKTIILTLITSLRHVIQIKWQMMGNPHLILLNGPGTCCIITVWVKLIDWLLLFTSSNIVYVESLARINTLSLTGKILYMLADEFVVQWEDLQTVYPRSRYFGILV